jgi:hypothetical protein
MSSTHVQGPIDNSPRALRQAGIKAIDIPGGVYACLTCGSHWMVNLPKGDRRMPARWWRCPDGCNSPEEIR